MINSLAMAKYISLTVDVWSDRRLRSFLGITAHFINETFEFKTIVICFKNIKDLTGVGIRRELDKIIDEFKIK